MGNIKGTYGYIDDLGDIKRVAYSTSNSSEVIAKPPESNVQRIPQKKGSTTRRPVYSSTPRIKLRSTTSTTEKPNYSTVVSIENEMRKTTQKPDLYQSTPKIILQGRPLVRSTPATQLQKNEGQLIRPEVVTVRPTEIPLFRRLALKHHILNDDKPVIEEPEEKSNILRRQLSANFDPQQHVYSVQQSSGNDSPDVYSASVTTGAPRPLFTTSSRPRGLSSTTVAPTRPTVRYPNNYQQTMLQDLEPNNGDYNARTTTTSATADITPTPVPIVQIPPNRASASQDPLVAIKHPFQQGTILVPLSQLQGRIVNNYNPRENQDYISQMEQYIRETTPAPKEEPEPRPIYVRRLPPPQFRPIPVQVDENGFIRDVPRPLPNVPTTPYPLPVPVTSPPRYSEEINDISPPVSTRDFQKLLQQLIFRQSRLERINAMMRNPQYQYQPMYRPTPMPYYIQGRGDAVQYIPEDRRQYFRQNPNVFSEDSQSYVPNRRVARLLQNQEGGQELGNPEYLPPDIREMLLLRMLQLAINPALPVNEDEMFQETTPVPQYKKSPKVRNVEILGEELEEEKRPSRIKRYRGSHPEYYKK